MDMAYNIRIRRPDRTLLDVQSRDAGNAEAFNDFLSAKKQAGASYIVVFTIGPDVESANTQGGIPVQIPLDAGYEFLSMTKDEAGSPV